MQMTFERVTLVYDARCSFCIRSLSLVRALDLAQVCRYEDSNDPAIANRFPVLRGADLDDAMYAVTASGRVYRGFFAFRRVIRSVPLAWPLLAIFYCPGAKVIGPRIYAWVARNRGRAGCASTCALPGPSPVEDSARRFP